MPNKKVRVELRVADMPGVDGKRYVVTKVTNSLNWTPGYELTEKQVQDIIAKPAVDVVILGAKR